MFVCKSLNSYLCGHIINNPFTMIKQDIISNVKDVAKISGDEAKKAVNTVLQSIENALIRGEEIQLIGFGTFKVTDKPERKGRNPKTGEDIIIPAHKSVSFKAGKAVNDKVNGK